MLNRDKKITLAYSSTKEDKFSVPSNLYIIATMNSQDRSIAFKETELQILRTEFRGRIEVAPTFRGYHVIKAREYVGTVVIPNHIIRIKPKISNVDFIYMIKYALRLPEIKLEDFPTDMYEDFYHILILFLLHHIGAILEKGLYKGYITKSDNVKFLRGKILFKEHLLYNQNRNDRIYCSFSEVTSDTTENRIIKFTLFYLSKYYFIDDTTRIEIVECYSFFIIR